MSWQMVHFSEIAAFRASLQFLAFSEAYLYSAAHLCAALAASPRESTYPRGAVVLSLSFHGIELFLKAAILEKVPDEQFRRKSGHDLEALSRRYTELYPGKKFAFEIPFGYEETVLVDPDPRVVEELKLLIAKHKRATPADQLHRYPRNIEGKPWIGANSFEPNSFAHVISKAQQDVKRLKELIFHG